MVVVVTDSCAAVPAPVIDELGIEVVPYHVHTPMGTLDDGVGMAADEFFAWVKNAEKWPTTANPSAGEYLEAYRRAARHQDGIVAISMTGTGSGGYQSALLAKRLAEQEMPGLPIEVIDTQTVAMAHGWAVIQAARAALKGLPFEEVKAIAQRTAEHAYVAFTNDTLEYLQRGGRIGKVAGMIGGVLSIKPIIGMRNGMPAPLSLARTRAAAYKRIVSLGLNAIPEGSTIRAALMHVAAPGEAESFRPLLEQRYSVIEWMVTQLTPALGMHSGPGTAGIAIIPDTLA